VGLAASILVSFFLAPFVVRSLGSTWYGVWAVVMQFTGYLYLLDFGVRESLIRYTSKYVARQQSRQLNQILTVAVVVYGAMTALALVATIALTWLLPRLLQFDDDVSVDLRWAIALVGATVAQALIFNVFSGVVLGMQRWVESNAIGIIFMLVRTLLIVLALRAGHGILALATIQLSIALASGLLTAAFARHVLAAAGSRMQLVRMTRRRFQVLAKRVLAYGGFVFLTNIGQKVIVASDAIIISAFLPVVNVAYYAVAGTLIEPLRSLLASTAHVFVPVASELHSAGRTSQVGDVMTTGSKVILVVALPVAATFAALGTEFIRLWMGKEFSVPSGEVLAILGVATLLSVPSFVTGMVLYGISKHHLTAYLKLGEALINILLSVLLIKRFGIVGVAYGVAIPHVIVSAFLLPMLACRAIDMPISKFYTEAFARPLLAGIPFVLAVFWLRENVRFNGLVMFFGAIALLCLIYLGLVAWIAVTPQERAWVLKRLRFH
jgi:O-antigen/teichoic acid export membrane protein